MSLGEEESFQNASVTNRKAIIVSTILATTGFEDTIVRQ
jgi:hypothetical protein